MVFNKPENLSENNKKASKAKKRNASNNSISYCLDKIKASWKQKNSIGGLIQEWENIAGRQLSSNCKPISLRNKILIIGASHPQWRQALLYSRPQLLSSLISAGYEIKEIRIQQYHFEKSKPKLNELDIWESHPSRTDIHGLSVCNNCGSPSPSGEIKLWGKCGFCRRKDLSF